jgi:hypothetical protein
MRFTLTSALALLLIGCGGPCGVLQSCPLGPRTADTDTASGGFASVSITNAWYYPITVNQVGSEYPGGQNCGFPLYPPGEFVQPGATATMSGTFTGCNGGIQTVWLLITGNGMKSETCVYAVSYSPVSQSFGVQYVLSMSGDFACRFHPGKTNGTATIIYRVAGSKK